MGAIPNGDVFMRYHASLHSHYECVAISNGFHEYWLQSWEVRRHFEWVSRMLATTMGAVMDPKESELVLELIVVQATLRVARGSKGHGLKGPGRLRRL